VRQFILTLIFRHFRICYSISPTVAILSHNFTIVFLVILFHTYDPHDLHGGLPAADVAHALGEGPLVDEAELEGVAAHLDEVVEEGAEAGQRVRRAEQGHVPELEVKQSSNRRQTTINQWTTSSRRAGDQQAKAVKQWSNIGLTAVK